MKDKKSTINRPLGRSNKDFRMWSAQRGARGELRDAVTDYEVVTVARGYTFLYAMPRTGRTHQIRAHFKAIHHPLVADSMYAPNKEKQQENTLGFDRVALHSSEITFHDLKGKSHTITAPYPKDFTKALKILQK